ncbi:MAG: hypothetical protein QOI00_1332, partial [Chloroflexota bacterium]|nr:hypothetical protein [Chloroflexota bacterium]
MARTNTVVAVLRADDPAWEQWLGNAHRDVFHRAGYHRFAQGSGEGDPYLVVVGDEHKGLAWPYLLRPVSGIPNIPESDATDVTSVYGYPGPVAWGCGPDDPFLGRAWLEVQAVWRHQKAVAAFTRFHPLLDNAGIGRSFVTAAGPTAPIAHVGETISVDLTLGYEGARSLYGRDLRREIDRSRRYGLITKDDPDWGELATFARLYRDTMTRLHASDSYYFDQDDFIRLRAALAGELHLLVTRVDGAVAAAGLFTEWDGIIEWFLVGTDSAFISRSPSKVLVDDAIAWAIGRGARILHLGGGRGGADDSLKWFKARFSPRRHAFHTGKWVLDARRYAELNEARGADLAGNAVVDNWFFPAYRAPLLASEAPTNRASELDVRPIEAKDAEALGELLVRIDSTYFQPHPMTADEASRIGRLSGRDVYMIGRAGGEAVAYGMLRGWDEGYEVPSLGVGVRRDQTHRGYGRAMVLALH